MWSLFVPGTGGNKGEDDTTEDLTQNEVFEEKLRETIDLASQKSAAGKFSKQPNAILW